MKELFLFKRVKPASITADAINDLIETELGKAIFPDGLKDTVHSECQTIIVSFLEHISTGSEPGQGFLPDFDRLLRDNRLYDHRVLMIARVWLGIVERLLGLQIKPDALRGLSAQMKTIASKYVKVA